MTANSSRRRSRRSSTTTPVTGAPQHPPLRPHRDGVRRCEDHAATSSSPATRWRAGTSPARRDRSTPFHRRLLSPNHRASSGGACRVEKSDSRARSTNPQFLSAAPIPKLIYGLNRTKPERGNRTTAHFPASTAQPTGRCSTDMRGWLPVGRCSARICPAGHRFLGAFRAGVSYGDDIDGRWIQDTLSRVYELGRVKPVINIHGPSQIRRSTS
jgi:hypothetical protein